MEINRKQTKENELNKIKRKTYTNRQRVTLTICGIGYTDYGKNICFRFLRARGLLVFETVSVEPDDEVDASSK